MADAPSSDDPPRAPSPEAPDRSGAPHLLVFGLGYSGLRIAADRRRQGWLVTGTTRSPGRAAAMVELGIHGLVFDGGGSGGALDDAVREALAGATHLLVTIPPGPDGDPVLRRFREEALSLGDGPLQWMGYMSTTGVYGDHGGDWVDESTPPSPGLDRTRRRLRAEREWSTLSGITGVPLQIFRISGIYGPGRSALDRIRGGGARSIVKAGSVFNRVHVDDLAGAVVAGMSRPGRTGVFNVSDDLPAPNHVVMRHAAEILDTDPPREVDFQDAELSPMGASFFAEDRRVKNERVRSELGYDFRYPTYREGLAAVLRADAEPPSGRSGDRP